jgi:hypothetical protein
VLMHPIELCNPIQLLLLSAETESWVGIKFDK